MNQEAIERYLTELISTVFNFTGHSKWHQCPRTYLTQHHQRSQSASWIRIDEDGYRRTKKQNGRPAERLGRTSCEVRKAPKRPNWFIESCSQLHERSPRNAGMVEACAWVPENTPTRWWIPGNVSESTWKAQGITLFLVARSTHVYFLFCIRCYPQINSVCIKSVWSI